MKKINTSVKILSLGLIMFGILMCLMYTSCNNVIYTEERCIEKINELFPNKNIYLADDWNHVYLLTDSVSEPILIQFNSDNKVSGVIKLKKLNAPQCTVPEVKK